MLNYWNANTDSLQPAFYMKIICMEFFLLRILKGTNTAFSEDRSFSLEKVNKYGDY